MIGKVVTVEESTLSLSLPDDMIGKKMKVIAFPVDEEADAIEELAAEFYTNESSIAIPQWQKDLVLAEKKRME